METGGRPQQEFDAAASVARQASKADNVLPGGAIIGAARRPDGSWDMSGALVAKGSQPPEAVVSSRPDIPEGAKVTGVVRRDDGTLDYSGAMYFMDQNESAGSDEPGTTGPETRELYSTELNALADRADYLWDHSLSAAENAKSAEDEFAAKAEAQKYRRVSDRIFDLVFNEDVGTIEQAKTKLEAERQELQGQVDGHKPSKVLTTQLETVTATLEFINSPVAAGIGETLKRGQKEHRRRFLVQEGKTELKEHRGITKDEVKASIDKAYRFQMEAEDVRLLESRFRVLNQHIQGIYLEKGNRGIQEYVLEMMKKFSKNTGLTIEDLSSLEVQFAQPELASRVTGRTVTRPLFIFKDDGQKAKITGNKRFAGFLTPKGFGHLVPGSGLEELPTIVAGNDSGTVLHEIMHSVDEKALYQKRKGYDCILEEAFAYLAEESGWTKSSPGGVREDWGRRMHEYYDLYPKPAENPMSKEEFSKKVDEIQKRVRALYFIGLDVPTILKSIAIADSLDDFFEITGGILQAPKNV